MKSSDLAKHYFFAPFSVSELTELGGKSKRRTFPAGEVIFHETDPSQSCFWLEFGAVRLGKKGSRHSTESTVLGPGSLFGELAFLDRRPRLFDAVAQEAISLVEIPFDGIKQALEHNPALGEKFYRSVALFLRDKLLHLPAGDDQPLSRYQ